jgi:hypothetical protein
MIFSANASVTDVIVTGNDCYRNDSYGGGMIINNSEATLTNVTVTDNTASNGGGIFILDTDATLINLTVSGNTATAFGGGLLVGANTNPTLTNSIIWGNNPNQIQGFGTPTITYSDIQGGWNGVGNIDSDPLFCNPDSGDFTLTENSPCIGTGRNGANMGALDVECEAILSTDKDVIPLQYVLHQNYPNPFNPTTQIRYELSEDALVSINIYDLMGRMIKSSSNSNQTAGYHSLQWDATNDIGEGVSAGMYIYTIQAGEYRSTKKMVLLK